MNQTIKPDESLVDIERRLQTALMAEADRCAQEEPPRLAAACRAPRQLRLPARQRHHSWRWAAAAAAALALLALPLRHSLRSISQPETLDAPTRVSPVIDREALYAALPHLPAPTRPPPPGRLRAALIITAPALPPVNN